MTSSPYPCFHTHHPYPVHHPDNLSSLDALLEALDNLEALVDVVGEAYDTSLKQGKYQTFTERL